MPFHANRLGYAGVARALDDHPLGSHHEIGWHLIRSAWGQGVATEVARAALDDAFGRRGLARVLAYTSAENERSVAVVVRLGLRRAPELDFDATYAVVGRWRGLVRIAEPRSE